MSFDTENFINEIECRPSIWNTASSDYSNRELKEMSWEEVTNLFGGEEVVPEEKMWLKLQLKKRWKGIRSCYSREIKRQKFLKFGSEGERKTEYIYFKQLQFLQGVVEVRDTPDEMEDTIEKNVEYLSPIADQNPIFDPDPIADSNRDETMDSDDKFITTFNRLIDSRERRDSFENDEDRLFLLSMLSTLRNVPIERKMATKIRLMTVLQEAVQGNPFNGHMYGYSESYYNGFTDLDTNQAQNNFSQQSTATSTQNVAKRRIPRSVRRLN